MNLALNYLITTVSLTPLGLNTQTEMQILKGLQYMNTILMNFNVLHDLPFWKTVGQYVLLELQTKSIHATYVAVAMQRSLEGSTNQAYSNRFYIRISGILNIDGTTILFPQFSGGPQKYKHKVGQIEIISGCEVLKSCIFIR